MSILITGNQGFIGSHLARSLYGNHLTGYDLKAGQDVRDRLSLDILFETGNFDVVINCAALTGVRRGELYPSEYISTNVLGLKNLIDMSEKYGVKHFIHLSSSSVYLERGEVPLCETDSLEPDSIYGMTKLMGEKLVQRSKLNWTIARPFTVYGHDGREDQVLEKWIKQAISGKSVSFYGDGSTGRGYTFIDDLVEGIKKIMVTGIKGIFNIGGNEYITLNDLWEICEKPERQMIPLPSGDRHGIYADIRKAYRVLGWSPKTYFRDKVSEIWRDRCAVLL